MNGFKLGRITAHCEYCEALMHLSLCTEVYFPKGITNIVCSYYEPSEEEHFIQILATYRVCGNMNYDDLHIITLTLDRWVCNTIFGTKKETPSVFPPAVPMIEEFDADGLVDKVSLYLPRLVRSEIDDECDWNMDACEHKAQQLAVGFLDSYIAVAKELKDAL